MFAKVQFTSTSKTASKRKFLCDTHIRSYHSVPAHLRHLDHRLGEDPVRQPAGDLDHDLLREAVAVHLPKKSSSEEILVPKVHTQAQQTVVTPTRRSSRRGRTPERKVEESSTSTTTTVTKDSSSASTLRVTRSVTKKLIPEEKRHCSQ
ncbi:hypothetical protein OS493_007296 [Desmophyllum pertusum]|uniref:Uncharacterized protein n=1 Tax=Desmophyllum pertusum TaxID=174260 RepID=A0A9W9Z320_9CNID|nr:hypothetical protein OS493_007296 [Desmophyllum pertusum]